MEHRLMGRSGCALSTLALGTMTFGSETDEVGSHDQLDAFVAAGGNLVDTADVYSAGGSEEIIGRWLAGRPSDVRDGVVLATKGRFATGPGPNDAGPSRRHLQQALEDSLRRLGVECVVGPDHRSAGHPSMWSWCSTRSVPDHRSVDGLP